MLILSKTWKLIELKRSILCVGLDPALPRQRSRWIISEEYVRKYPDENDARFQFCLDIINETYEYVVAYKVNAQYVFGFTKNHHKRLVDYIHKHDAIAILDLKLNDIDDTAESAIFHIAECGYDMITFNPLLGNLCQMVKMAREIGRGIRGEEIGVLSLVLTSNPEAPKYQKYAKLNDKPLFIALAEEVKECDAAGCVVGATRHVTEEDIRMIRQVIGEDRLILFPGIGVQRGEIEKVLKVGGKMILINVGRDVIYAKKPKEKVREYHDRLSLEKS
ncbi:MAG: hypothetical protein B6V02_02680 [Thermoprotei archaeon ex4572_64]|nr:MAG: hypothetical protein B6V02_02680 [Thermoprotei archaeon ex4572_64]